MTLTLVAVGAFWTVGLPTAWVAACEIVRALDRRQDR